MSYRDELRVDSSKMNKQKKKTNAGMMEEIESRKSRNFPDGGRGR